jgi:hypothetical protein
MLSEGDVLWSGDSGGQWEISDYSIVFSDKNDMTSSYSGCWCPEEAVEFLRYHGINVHRSKGYSSGWSAPGCFWKPNKQPRSPHLEASWQVYSGNMGTNKEILKDYKLLKKYDD